MIALDGVTRAYVTGGQPVPVLHRIDLRIERGERVALVGASGSGKSTLLHILGGLDRPTGGSYRYAGQDVGVMDGIRLATFRRDHIGFVFQAFHLLPVLTALENVELPLVYAGLPAAARRRRAAVLLERLGLGRHLRHRPNQLSGGHQQRVAIARALVNDPETVLADEPTGNLDSRAGAEVVSLLEAQHASDRTVILAGFDGACRSCGWAAARALLRPRPSSRPLARSGLHPSGVRFRISTRSFDLGQGRAGACPSAANRSLGGGRDEPNLAPAGAEEAMVVGRHTRVQIRVARRRAIARARRIAMFNGGLRWSPCPENSEPPVWGRFAKRHFLDCGRSRCGVCHWSKRFGFPTLQALRADLRWGEQIE